MHDAIIPAEQVDDFVILRARAFTSAIRRSLTNEILKQEKLSVLEWKLLFSVARFGSCHLAYVTQHTSIDPAHGSRAAAALEKKGLIERSEDPDNRRRKLISLTSQGMQVFERIWPKARENVARRTARLTRAEVQEFKRLLDLLCDSERPA